MRFTMKKLLTPGDTPLEVSFYDNGKSFTLKAKDKIAPDQRAAD